VQRMEAAEKRREDEKMRRFAQEKARAEEEFAAYKKAHSRATARNYLSGLGRKCLNLLEAEGLFADKVQVAVETDFLPWLINSVVSGIDGVRERQAIMNQTVTSVMDTLAKPHQKALDQEQERRDLLDAAEKKYRETLAEMLDLKKKKKDREAEEAKLLEAFDSKRDPVVIPDGTPFGCGGIEEGPQATLIADDGTEEKVPIGGADPEALFSKINGLIEEQKADGGTVKLYVTGEEEERKVTGAVLLPPEEPAEGEVPP